MVDPENRNIHVDAGDTLLKWPSADILGVVPSLATALRDMFFVTMGH